MELGRLKTVDVRGVWAREDRDFTPWLLANSERLSEALGIDVELHQAEHAVGTFSLDLLGKIPGSDEVLIVENQLQESDHKHLGQLMTYAGGTDAHTVVWIATSFREEHRSAMDWLNENTNEGVRFFAVEITAVQIDDSVPAPLFKVVAKPNDWGKSVKASAQSSVANERSVAYRDFWALYLAKVRETYPSWTSASGDYYQSWLVMKSGYPNIYFPTVFNRQGLYAGIETQDAEHNLYGCFLPAKESIEQSFGGPLIWEEIEGRKICKVGDALLGDESGNKVDIMNRDEWPKYIDWFLDAQVRLHRAFEEHRNLLP